MCQLSRNGKTKTERSLDTVVPISLEVRDEDRLAMLERNTLAVIDDLHKGSLIDAALD